MIALLSVVLAACDSGAGRITAPAGASEFRRFVTIGTGFTMGEQSGGVVYESQLTTWPVYLAARMEAGFRVPALKQPGCTPPLVAPLSLRRTLEGPLNGVATCAGKLGTDTLPANNLAVSGATAWDALHVTPRTFAGLTASLDQSRYSLVLPPTQTQLQALQSSLPTLVGIELGAGEVMRAMNSGLVTVATSYTQKTPWTLMPAALFAAVLDSLADSVAATGARGVLIGLPPVTSLPAWRTGDLLWQQRDDLAANGIIVALDCAASTNLVHVAALVPTLAAAAKGTATAQALSCADKPGVADHILTAADVQLIGQTVTAINAAIKATADKHQFAYVETPLFSSEVPFAAPAFTATTLLSSDQPFGMATSLDGVLPSAYGHALMADAVAQALNQRYGWKIPIPPRPL
jgi:lysophospholipase L1-like esterase